MGVGCWVCLALGFVSGIDNGFLVGGACYQFPGGVAAVTVQLQFFCFFVSFRYLRVTWL